MLAFESVEDLLSLPSDDPLLTVAPYILTLDGGGSELAELSLKVDAESLSPALPTRVLVEGFRKDELEPPLSDNLPYSPNFLGGGIKDLAGEPLRLLVFELSESPPSDFLRCGGVSDSGRRL